MPALRLARVYKCVAWGLSRCKPQAVDDSTLFAAYTKREWLVPTTRLPQIRIACLPL